MDNFFLWYKCHHSVLRAPTNHIITLRKDKIRSNHEIRSPELRVISETGENLGVIPTREALKRAQEAGLDLIEISPNALPPVARIGDFGKYAYEEAKKQKVAKARSHTVEIKGIQVRIGTGEHDLELKAKKVSEWVAEGNRVKIELFLPGRSKYLDPKFLEERLARILALVSAPHKVSEKPQKGPKGISIMIEKA